MSAEQPPQGELATGDACMLPLSRNCQRFSGIIFMHTGDMPGTYALHDAGSHTAWSRTQDNTLALLLGCSLYFCRRVYVAICNFLCCKQLLQSQ